MDANKPITAVKGYIEANALRHLHGSDRPRHPAIAITRQTGARAATIGRILQNQLQEAHPPEATDWSFSSERDLLERVLKENGLPLSLARHYPENAPNVVDDTVEGIVGDHPSAFAINDKCHEAALRLLASGHSIVVGRCSNLIAKDLDNVLRVRLVGSAEKRAEHIAQKLGFDPKRAADHIRKEDALRQRYAKTHFNERDIDNPLLYDLALNTDHFSDRAASELIMQAAMAKCPMPAIA